MEQKKSVQCCNTGFIKFMPVIVLFVAVYFITGCKDDPNYPKGDDVVLVEDDSVGSGLYYADWTATTTTGDYTVHMTAGNCNMTSDFSIESGAAHIAFYHPPDESLPQTSYYCGTTSDKYAPGDTVVIAYKFPNMGSLLLFIRKN